ncbi:DNAse I-like superfamily protein [Euphorbia peplus]|nr:DNAse I-like superfamily protein [Euphorbia peplus]
MLLFYKNLIGTARGSRDSIDPAVISVGSGLTFEDCDLLCQLVSNADIKNALWSINVDNAPEVDGFSSLFFKNRLSIVGNDVCKGVKDFFANGKLLKQINSTALVIIPKVTALKGLSDYRPIACCTVLYKIITKILTTRFNLVINKLVSANQSAFILGRNISDNVLLVHELIRNYQGREWSSMCNEDRSSEGL